MVFGVTLYVKAKNLLSGRMPDHMRKKFGWLWIWGGVVVILFIILFSIMPNVDSISQGPKIGLVEITGPIYSSQQAVKDLNYFKHRRDIDAIIIRLETPGGGVAASQEIFEKVKSMSSGDIPILASMGGVAASGGYYIAIGADSIMANPGTATGSIGVIMGYPVAATLLNKLGLEYETVKSGPYKDSGSTFRDVTDTDREYFQQLVDNLYQQFVRAIAEQREMTVLEVETLGNGKVYSGEQALEYGLIDMLGTLDDCIELAGKLAGSEETPQVIEPPRPRKGILSKILGESINLIPEIRSYPVPEYKLY